MALEIAALAHEFRSINLRYLIRVSVYALERELAGKCLLGRLSPQGCKFPAPPFPPPCNKSDAFSPLNREFSLERKEIKSQQGKVPQKPHLLMFRFLVGINTQCLTFTSSSPCPTF